jgi:predicted esterase
MSWVTFASFSDVFAAARAKSDAGDPESALLLSDRERTFPLHAGLIYSSRAALLAELDRSDSALDVLDGALAAGCRYRAEWLRDDERLAPLRANARFEKIVERAASRFEHDQADSRPTLELLTPTVTRPASGYPTLLALHGNNSNVAETLPYWRSASELGWLVALPQSSQIGTTPGAYTWNDRDRTHAELEQHREALREQRLIDERSVVLAGFSMGGLQALALTLTRRFDVCGALSVAAYLPHIREFSKLIAAGNASGIVFYIAVGANDTNGYAGAKQLAAELEHAGVAVSLDERPDLGHVYPPDMDETLRRALALMRSAHHVVPR